MAKVLLPAAERLLTPAEVGALFRVDPKTVTRWANAGRLTSLRTVGGHRRYREAEVRALLGGTPVPVPPVAWPLHSIGVEKLDAATADEYSLLPGTPAIVERRKGEFSGIFPASTDDLEEAAKSYASTYGATYVPRESR